MGGSALGVFGGELAKLFGFQRARSFGAGPLADARGSVTSSLCYVRGVRWEWGLVRKLLGWREIEAHDFCDTACLAGCLAIVTMNQLVRDSVSTRRSTLILLGLFSALALVLAAIGIYGVISYSVARRCHEIGIRMALGAQRGNVLRMILSQGLRIAGAGVVIGIAASAGLTRLMTKLLFSVSASDPLTFAAVALVLVLIAMLACYIPARRTLRVDPMIALRHE